MPSFVYDKAFALKNSLQLWLPAQEKKAKEHATGCTEKERGLLGVNMIYVWLYEIIKELIKSKDKYHYNEKVRGTIPYQMTHRDLVTG